MPPFSNRKPHFQVPIGLPLRLPCLQVQKTAIQFIQSISCHCKRRWNRETLHKAFLQLSDPGAACGDPLFIKKGIETFIVLNFILFYLFYKGKNCFLTGHVHSEERQHPEVHLSKCTLFIHRENLSFSSAEQGS